jgi:hypothetical protein
VPTTAKGYEGLLCWAEGFAKNQIARISPFLRCDAPRTAKLNFLELRQDEFQRTFHALRCVGGLRAVLGNCAGGGKPPPRAKASPTEARGLIHFGPEARNRVPVRFRHGVERVAGIRGCVAGCAHPLEKSASGFTDTSIHRLASE